MVSILENLKTTALGFLDHILPPLCLICKKPTILQGTLCSTCWPKLNFISKPFCFKCGFPFDFNFSLHQDQESKKEQEHKLLCPLCIKNTFEFDKARSLWRYDQISRQLVLSFKHADKMHLGKSLATLMLKQYGTFIQEHDIIAPIPLHSKKLFVRKFNQSALLVQHIRKNLDLKSDQSHIRIILTLLVKKKNTKPQAELSKEERWQSAKNNYAMNPEFSDLIQGKSVLLIDDVMTTGATLSHCAKTLKKQGAKRVNVLTLCRTIKN